MKPELNAQKLYLRAWSRDVTVDQLKLNTPNRVQTDTRTFDFATPIHAFFAVLALALCSTFFNGQLRLDDDTSSQSHACTIRESQLDILTLNWRTVYGRRLAFTAEDGHSTHPFYGCIGAAIGG